LRGKDTASAIAALAAFPGTTIDISPLAGSFDAAPLAQELAGMLRAAGWDVSTAQSFHVAGYSPPPGILVGLSQAPDPTPYNALIDWLQRFGLRAEAGGPRTQHADARLLVSY
jgi:hypothetical protein